MRSSIILLLLLTGIARGHSQTHIQEALELERKVFETRSELEKNALLLQKARLYKEYGDYKQAQLNLKRIDTTGLPAETQAKVLYERSLNYLLDHSEFAAYSVLKDLNKLSVRQNDDGKLLELLVLNENEKWKECREKLLAEARARKQPDTLTIQLLQTSPGLKDPYKARLLSSVFPGTGQMYAGYPLKGSLSILLNGAFLTFAVYNATGAYYLMAFESGIAPFFKFYKGGIELSEKLAHRKNEEVKTALKARYSELIFRVFSDR